LNGISDKNYTFASKYNICKEWKDGLAENRFQKLLLQLAHNAGDLGFSRKDAFESLHHVLPASNTHDEKLRKIGRILVNMAKSDLLKESSNGKKK